MRLLTGTATVEDLDAAVADLDRVGDRHDCTLQAVDARYVAGPEHLRRALELADRERARGDGIARERAVEVLLYAAGRRQISRALEMGLDAGETPAVVLVAAPSDDDPAAEVTVDERPPDSTAGGSDSHAHASGRERAAAGAVCDLAWFDPGPVEMGDPATLRAFFDVGETELAATDAPLADLVRERVALLVVDR